MITLFLKIGKSYPIYLNQISGTQENFDYTQKGINIVSFHHIVINYYLMKIPLSPISFYLERLLFYGYIRTLG